MVNNNKKNITVTANDNDKTIRLENPNLKIVSKQGEQISVHNFFELFSTVEKTKKIKKQLDKEIKMLKQMKLSFQKKLKKFKTAKILSVRKLKEREDYLIRHYEEIVAKMKFQAEEEIKKQFNGFKDEISAEKDRFISEIDTSTAESINSISFEGNKFTKTLSTAETKIADQTKSNLKDIDKKFNSFKSTALTDIEKTKADAIKEVEDVGTTKEKFRKFTKISQDYIKETIDAALLEIHSVKETMSKEVSELNTLANKQISSLQQSTKEQGNKILNELNELKDKLTTDIEFIKKSTSDELSTISKQTKQESTDTLKTILNNIEDFSSKTKAEIEGLTTRYEAEQDTMIKNTYKDLQRIQTKLQEIDKTEDIRAISEHFKELKKDQDLAIEDIKFNINQAHSQSIDELLTKVQAIKAANKEEMNLVKNNISEHETLFYEKVQKNLDELLDISKMESNKQLEETSQIITDLKDNVASEMNTIRQELKQEKLQIVEESMRTLDTLKIDINKKADQQIAEASGMLKDFKQSFEYTQTQLLAQSEDKWQDLESSINTKIQTQIESAKINIEEIRTDSQKRIFEVTKDVEAEQKILNKLIVQVKGIKTTLETGVFANLDSTLENIESIKQTHSIEMENLKNENNKTQQEAVRQLKQLVERSIETHLETALTRINSLQDQLKAEKNELTESTIKLNRLQSQTQQEIYGQLENTLSSVNTIKQEAEQSIKKLKTESFAEILNLKKGLHQIVSYLKKQKTKSEKKVLSTEKIITKKNSTSATDELISMLLKDDLSKN